MGKALDDACECARAEEPRVLDRIREDLRDRGWLPVIFDFDKPTKRDLTETVSTLAHRARFIVAALTDPSSIPHELMRIIPGLPSVPVLPLLHVSAQGPYAMFEHLQRFPWVVSIYRYQDEQDAIAYVTGPGIAALPLAAPLALRPWPDVGRPPADTVGSSHILSVPLRAGSRPHGRRPPSARGAGLPRPRARRAGVGDVALPGSIARVHFHQPGPISPDCCMSA